ncbi:MAG: imidazole glycerol phosphate synthase subunit HisH [Thermaerobacter sp.]|nr:imidazole glycerol phosphate synthase subunit HisH [Thermaerobacter sp.]
MKVAIVNYGNGNFGSLLAALARLDLKPSIWQRGSDVHPVDLVIFPGVGALPDVMLALSQRDLLVPLTALYHADTPFLGICLGMQLFFAEGDEGGRGLGWLKGKVPALAAPILPHIGWNTVSPDPTHGWLYAGLAANPAFYFVHTYCVEPLDDSLTAGTTVYHATFPSAVVAPPLYGVQFHPELSGRSGHRLLQNLLARIQQEARP